MFRRNKAPKHIIKIFKIISMRHNLYLQHHAVGFLRVLEPGAHEHHVALHVLATTARPARHLQQLGARQLGDARAGPFGEARDDRCASRHVDAGGEGLCRKADLEQARVEEVLDQGFVEGEEACVVNADAVLKQKPSLRLEGGTLRSASLKRLERRGEEIRGEERR